MGAQAESWGMSWEYNSLIHRREDRDLISQMDKYVDYRDVMGGRIIKSC